MHIVCIMEDIREQLLDYCNPLVASCNIDFPCSLKLWVSILFFKTTFTFYWSLITTFKREIPSFSPASYSEVFSDLLGYTFSKLLPPLVAEFFAHIPFLDPATYQVKWWQPLFYLFITKVVLKLKFVVSLWPSDLGQLSVGSPWPSARAHSGCHHWEHTQGVCNSLGVYVGKMQSAGVAVAHWGICG